MSCRTGTFRDFFLRNFTLKKFKYAVRRRNMLVKRRTNPRALSAPRNQQFSSEPASPGESTGAHGTVFAIPNETDVRLLFRLSDSRLLVVRHFASPWLHDR